MRLPFMKSKQRPVKEFAQRPEAQTPPVSDDSVQHILVRIGKLSPFVLGAIMSSYPDPPTDDDVVRKLLQEKAVLPEDVRVARMVQVKLRAGEPIYEEWAKLEAIMEESRRCAQELTTVISEGKQRRRVKGEDTAMFLSPRRLRSAT